jgi:hypothetical protein
MILMNQPPALSYYAEVVAADPNADLGDIADRTDE